MSEDLEIALCGTMVIFILIGIISLALAGQKALKLSVVAFALGFIFGMLLLWLPVFI